MQRSLELRRRIFGNEGAETLSTMQELGELYLGAGKYSDAEAILGPLVDVRRRKFGSNDQETLRVLNDFAAVVNFKGDYTRASRLREEVLEGDRHSLGADHPYTAIAMTNLAGTYIILGNYTRAEELYKEALSIDQRLFGQAHPVTLGTMNGLAQAYRNEGEFAKAEPLFEKVVESRRQSLGEEHADTCVAANTLAVLYVSEGRHTDADMLLTHCLEIARRIRPEHPYRFDLEYSLAESYRGQNKTEAAESLYNGVLAGRRKTLGPQHPNTVRVLISLGEMKLEQKRYAEAQEVLREALAIQEKTSQTDWRHYQTQALLGETLALSGHPDDGRSLLTAAYDGLSQKSSTIPFDQRRIVDTVRDWKSRLP
jgi:tetratricopeptide (TPR) repeat protein